MREGGREGGREGDRHENKLAHTHTHEDEAVSTS